MENRLEIQGNRKRRRHQEEEGKKNSRGAEPQNLPQNI